MIVRMKKVSLLCLALRRDEALHALRDLGVLHVSALHPPAGQDLEKSRERLAQAGRALAVFDSVCVDAKSRLGVDSDGRGPTGEEIVAQVLQLAERREEAEASLKILEAELERLRPLGDFEPEVARRMADKGVFIGLYQASGKSPIDPPKGAVLTILNRDPEKVWFALAGPAEVFETQPGYESIPLPEHSPTQLRGMVSERQQEVARIDEELRTLSVWRNAVADRAAQAEELSRLLEVRAGMGSTDRIAYLRGFCPVSSIDRLRHAAADKGWGLVLEDPEPDDVVPTLLHYPRLVRPIKAAFDALEILPGYREADISAVFLIFFSLFFAMLIGDAGYGLLFLALTLLARARFRKAPAYPFTLLTLLSVCTIAFGILTGNYFGVTDLPAPLKVLVIDWLAEMDNMIALCFLIGAIHLTVAHTWNAVTVFPAPRAYAQIGWIGLTWTMFFAARTMVLQQPFPLWVFYLLAGAMVLIVLFITPVRELRSEWIRHAMLPLNVISCFVDVISYIRLFAVGLATLLVAENFNQMALAAGFNSVIAGFVAALILVGGHVLNILLCGLAILVHGVRLNTLEFSLHKDMQWSGFPYEPFERKGRQAAATGEEVPLGRT
jgi:V/A-type H+-transporting ATPase subunit I